MSVGVYQDWIGREQQAEDEVNLMSLGALAATLGHVEPGANEPVPPCGHWLLFNRMVPAGELGSDGHARRGDFLPPVELPRRMWAGSRVCLHAPLYPGDAVSRRTSIEAITEKTGRNGALVFVYLRHRIFRGATLVVEEEQDIVYRELASGALHTSRADHAPQWSRTLEVDPILLFRYSALTCNSHRIHYDRDYAIGVEGYDNLVVQGPLTATLLMDLLRAALPDVQIAAFDFRGVRPVLAGTSLRLCGTHSVDTATLWVEDEQGYVAMRATANLQNH
ncbi:MAG: MaoC family dehydratase N-terminal domain-containing protein [Pseudomonadota bacterium]